MPGEMPASFPAFEENFWVIAQPFAGAPGHWLARCLNLDVDSSSTSLDGALRALAEAMLVCLGEGPSRHTRRRARREEWRLLERVLRDGQVGAPRGGADVTVAAQLRLVRETPALGALGPRISLRRFPCVWLERAAASSQRAGLLAQPAARRRAARRERRRSAQCGCARPTWAGARGINMPSVPEIIITTQDFERLHRLVACSDSLTAEQLDAELARARLIAPTEIPSDVVTMNSNVTYEDAASGEQRTVRVVYPKDAEPARGWVSVLAPVGAALLGLRQGQAIDWPTPSGTKRLRVLAVPYQPESHGHYAL
jgi:regulator of nucleoside diphosphate kinase